MAIFNSDEAASKGKMSRKRTLSESFGSFNNFERKDPFKFPRTAPSPFGSSERKKEWACVKSLAGPRCIYSPTMGESNESSGFYTEDECLASDCYRLGPDMLETPDLVSLMSEYLGVRDLEQLAMHDQPTEAAIARQRDLRSSAKAMVDNIFSYPTTDLAKLRDDIIRESQSDEGLSSRTIDVLELLVDELIRYSGAGSFIFEQANLPDLVVVDAVEQLFPERFQDFVWAIIGRNGTDVPGVTEKIDFGQGGFLPLTDASGLRTIINEWIREHESNDTLTSHKIDGLMSALADYLGDRKDFLSSVTIGALLAKLAIDLMNPHQGEFSATDEHLRLLNHFLTLEEAKSGGWSESERLVIYMDGMPRLLDLGSVIDKGIPISDAFDELLSTLVEIFVLDDEYDLERVKTYLARLLVKTPKTLQTLERINRDFEEQGR